MNAKLLFCNKRISIQIGRDSLLKKKSEIALNTMISFKLTFQIWFGFLQPRLKLYSLQYKNEKDLMKCTEKPTPNNNVLCNINLKVLQKDHKFSVCFSVFKNTSRLDSLTVTRICISIYIYIIFIYLYISVSNLCHLLCIVYCVLI